MVGMSIDADAGRRGSPVARRSLAGWVIAVGLVVTSTIAAIVLGLQFPDPDFPSAVLTQSPTWLVVMTPSFAFALAIVLWAVRHDERRLARWMLAACAAVAAYWLAPSIGTALIAVGGTGSPLFALTAAVALGAWTTVLALLQLTALAAARVATGRAIARRARWVVGVGMAIPATVALLLPFPDMLDAYPGMPTLLPDAVVRHPAMPVVSTVCLFAWMASLFVAPIALWACALRSDGIDRRALVRIALGALMPAMVVALCGLLAELEQIGASVEVDGLAVGFSLALPLTLGWLTATMRDARTVSARFTSISAVVRALLWALYVFAMIQLITPLARLFGGSAAAGAFAAIAALAATFVPWRMLVGWCARKADPRAAVARAAVAADRTGAPGAVAERALRDALGDPGLCLLITIGIEEHPVWVDATGTRSEPPPSDAVLLPAPQGAPRAAVLSRSRFIDARPLLEAVRPLIERAALEAEVRARAAQADAERRRADSASAEARRRIERDLHDGVQGRLVSLGLGLSLAREDLPDPLSRDLIDETVAQLRDAVAELRELSSGDLSTRLTEIGLAAAVGELVRRMPVAVQVQIAPVRLSRDVEAVAYFVVAEAVTNAIKHGAPSQVLVRVDGDAEIVVRVADDGSGGADLRAGSGLRGLQERVHAVGGRLLVSEAVPRGTLVEAVLPCGS